MRVTWARRWYARLQRWADAGWSSHVVFAWGLAQGLFFPGLADLFFVPIALARPQRAYRLALIASAGTVIGAALLFQIGAQALEWLDGPIANLFDITPARLAESRAFLAKWGPLAAFLATVSPLSVKLVSIAAGATGVAFWPFVGALALGRLGRAMVLAWLIRNGGASTVERWCGATLSPDARASAP